MSAKEQLAQLKQMTDGCIETELGVIRELHEELSKTGRLGDLPGQKELADVAIQFCIDAIGSARDKCTCKTKEELQRTHPPKSMCPQCQLALRTLRVFVQIEALSVRRASIQENIFRDILQAKIGVSKGEADKELNLREVVEAARSPAALEFREAIDG